MSSAATTSNSNINPVTVKIVSDIVWPFCFVGLRNLEAASQLAGVPTNLSWEPFLLNPRMPPQGEKIMDHLVKKYGPGAVRNFGNPDSSLMRAGRDVGISFKLDRNIYPTVQAHAVIEYVKNDLGDIDKSNQMMEELYKRYFEQGENINSVPVLQQVGAMFGIDNDVIERVAQDQSRHESILQKDHMHKARMQIRGVPFYIIEQQDGSQPVGFSGAQPPQMISEYLKEAAGLEE